MQTLSIVEKKSPALNEAEAKKERATELYTLGDFEGARKLLIEALGETKDDDMKLALASNWAAVERRLGNNHTALSLYNLMSDLVARTQSDLLKGHYHNGLGLVLRALGFNHKSLNEYQTAIKFYQKTTDWTSLKNTENNLAFLLIQIGRAGEAIERLKKIITNLELLNQKARAMEVLDTLALAYQKIGDTDSALDCAVQSLSELRKLGEVQASKKSEETLKEVLEARET